MTDSVFVMGDGDDIRKRIEFYLLSGDLEHLQAFSTALTEAIQETARLAVSTMESKIVLAGGDDILFVTTLSNYREETLRALMHEFSKRTACHISFGVGPTLESAFINLRLAKAQGRGSVVASGLA